MRRYFIYPLIACQLAAFFCGCSTGKKSQVQQDVTLDATLSSAIEAAPFEEGMWPSRQWWEIFDDVQLGDLIEKALTQSPSIKEARAHVMQAEASARKIRSSLLPSLSADYGESWTYFSKNGFVRSFYPIGNSITVPSKMNLIDLSMNFFYEFDFFGKNRKMFKAALGQARASRAESIQVELTLSTMVAFAYFEWQTHSTELKTLLQVQQDWKEGQGLIKEQNSAGVANTLKVLDVTNALLSVEQKISDVKKKLLIDEYVLKALLGESPDVDLALREKALTLSKKISLPSHIGADLLSRRADLTAMIWHVESAAKHIGVAKADFFPNINLSVIGGIESLSFPNLFTWGSKTGSLAPAIHLPLFTGGRLRANLSGKVAQYNAAVEKYNQALFDAAKEVATEIATMRSLFDMLDIQKKIVAHASQKKELSSDRFSAGVDNYLSYLVADEEMLNAELDRIELENYRMLCLVRLVKALGGGFIAEKLPSLAPKEASWK